PGVARPTAPARAPVQARAWGPQVPSSWGPWSGVRGLAFSVQRPRDLLGGPRRGVPTSPWPSTRAPPGLGTPDHRHGRQRTPGLLGRSDPDGRGEVDRGAGDALDVQADFGELLIPLGVEHVAVGQAEPPDVSGRQPPLIGRLEHRRAEPTDQAAFLDG